MERTADLFAVERRLFTAYGISQSDLTWSDRPVRLRSVVGHHDLRNKVEQRVRLHWRGKPVRRYGISDCQEQRGRF